MKRDDASQLIADGLAQLGKSLAENKSEELLQYLAVMSRFTQYSFGNIMLILMQRPGATHVAGFHAWKKLGRSVKKGESGIGILAPIVYKAKKKKKDDGDDKTTTGKTIRGFKVVHVFDVTQTHGEEIRAFTAIHGEPGDKLAALERAIGSLGIRIVDSERLGARSGASTLGTVHVKSSLPPAERFAILAHEVAHELLHDVATRRNGSKKVLETEAEATAFVVCSACGLDSAARSADYIKLYQGDEETLSESLADIQRVGSQLVALIQEHSTNSDVVVENDTEKQCAHSLDCGDRQSTWIADETEHGTRVSCSVCGKFYGYLPESQSLESTAPLPDPEPSADEIPDEELVVGRADYQERRDARIDRYEDRALQASQDSDAAFNQAHQMASVIPFGQPILVGHHSERRDRNYRGRIQNTFRKGAELSGKATHYSQKAAAAESSTAISSDDPQAVIKLNDKLAACELRQERMKKVNAAWRSAKRPKPDDIAGWTLMAEKLEVTLEDLGRLRRDTAQRMGFSENETPYPAYALSNNNAEIRRIKQRIETLRASAGRETTEVDHGVCRVVENTEENRVQLFFDGKPPKQTRELLKENGFRWARSVEAWQRLLNSQGRSAARYVVEQLTKETNSQEVP